MNFYSLAMGRLTEVQSPQRRQLRLQIQSISCPTGDVSGLGCGSVLWCQGKLVSESGEFTPLYQGTSSNFQEGDNLTTRVEKSVAINDLKGVELFMLTYNLVFESVLYRGRQKSPCCLRSFSGCTRYR